MNQQPLNWYVVYTKPRWEKKVAELLSRDKIVNYCPLNKVTRQWSDRKKIVMEPLFTSYVFVNMSIEKLTQVRQTDGIINFLYWLGKPAVIKNEEIEVIRNFMSEHENVQLEKAVVNLDDKIRVVSGPLMKREGQIIEIRHKTVRVLLPSLGYMLKVEIDRTNLEKINSFTDNHSYPAIYQKTANSML